MRGLVEEGQEQTQEDAEGAIIDLMLIGAAEKVEHYEISGYGTGLLRQTEEEEDEEGDGEFDEDEDSEEGEPDEDVNSGPIKKKGAPKKRQ